MTLGEFIPPPFLDQIQELAQSVVDVMADQAALHRLAQRLDLTIAGAIDAAETRLDLAKELSEANRSRIGIRIGTLRERLFINGLVDRATAAAESAGKAEAGAQQAARSSKAAAGDAATGELSEHFATLAHQEHRAAVWWRAVALSLGLAVAGAALLLLGNANGLSLADAARKAAVGIPLAVVAAYSAKESAGHRGTYLWARRVEVQLRTMRAFIEPLDDQLRQLVLTIIAFRVFADHPETGNLTAQDPDPVTPIIDLDSIVQRLVDGLLQTPAKNVDHVAHGTSPNAAAE